MAVLDGLAGMAGLDGLLDETEAILGDPRLGDPLFRPNQSPPSACPGPGGDSNFSAGGWVLRIQ